ncbi:glycosyltransferase family 4 protein [Robertkochia solimangrovi]|uniref:glycosyltransferase family 4 protein n=1 Tax=Robertkochia solimangrovi TaxID=2213046 RepID=UPI00117E0030|nr:glycosyltransferase family 1 protein [Robertkochia solimangrovi]TRZ46022.1 glycosyltransferase family 1 protein [Robertkochia solimangrovi]
MEKIVIDARMINNSGIGVYIRSLVRRFSKSDKLVIHLLVYNNDVGCLGDMFHYIPIKSKIYSIGEIAELPLKIPKCDVFWTPHFNIPILPISAKRRIVTIHDVYHLRFADELSWIKKWYAKLFYNLAIRLSDTIITVSEFSKSEINSLIIHDKDINVIHNGFETLESGEIIEDKVYLEKYLLYVGNIKPHKNLEVLIEGFKLFKENFGKYEDLSLKIIGRDDNDEYSQYIKKSISSNNDIEMIGYVSNERLVQLYKGATIFILPSKYEGFGIPILEAFSYQIPVISSNAASLPEVGGNAVLYFKSDSPENLAGQLLKLVSNNKLQYKLVNLGVERMKLFSWKTSFELHKALIVNEK